MTITLTVPDRLAEELRDLDPTDLIEALQKELVQYQAERALRPAAKTLV